MTEILISEDIRGAAVDELASRFNVSIEPDLWRDPEALRKRIASVDGLIIRNQTQVDTALLAAAKKLKVIGRAGVGLDNVDVPAVLTANVTLTSTPEQNAISVAELAIGLMIALARHIVPADADTKAGNWSRRRFWGTELYGRTFGIIGAGKIGFLTARRAAALGMKILATDPFLSRDNVLLYELGAELVPLEELLKRSDVISSHLPATPQTIGLLNASCFALMKPTAYFINTSRGEVVNEDDLLKALQAKKIAGAALDVRAKEPPVAGEFEKLTNVILTPHIAALSDEAQERVTVAICEDVARVLDGKPAMNPVTRG